MRQRWRRLLDDGAYGTLDDLAKAERVSQGYVSRVLRLTLLAPQIVEAILDGRQPETMRLEDLLEGLPLDWEEQRQAAVNTWSGLGTDTRGGSGSAR